MNGVKRVLAGLAALLLLARFPGAIVAATIIVFISEMLRPLEVYRLIIFGALIIVAMIYLPQGLMGVIASASELASRRFKERR
ncbi:MAG: hypothetical protein HY530_08560 [Chloroflexi bacterium]|nr:hypothetical protein [Chloroflexota bacterium]